MESCQIAHMRVTPVLKSHLGDIILLQGLVAVYSFFTDYWLEKAFL